MLHFLDRCDAASLSYRNRNRAEITVPWCVNINLFRYGFCAGAKVIRLSMNIAKLLILLWYDSTVLKLRANGRISSQNCAANNVGSCCIRVGSGVQTNATINSQQCWDLQCIVLCMRVRGPNNVGETVETDPTLLLYFSAISIDSVSKPHKKRQRHLISNCMWQSRSVQIFQTFSGCI